MATEPALPSPRRAELLDGCYRYLLEHGLAGLSLRPLAAAVGTSPRVLLYLFDSKENLLRELLSRARKDQVAMVGDALRGADGLDLETAADRLWEYLSDPRQRPMVRLTYEAFLLSLRRDPGPWQGFAAESANDWGELLYRAQPGVPSEQARARATRALALIRGLLLDLLAGGDNDRITAAATGW